MKKISIILLLLGFFIIISTGNSYANTAKIDIFLNGEKQDTNAFINNDRVFLPMRDVFRMFFIEVNWDHKTKTATANIGDEQLILQKDNLFATKIYSGGNKDRIELDGPPTLYKNSIYLPLRSISGMFEGEINWDSNNKNVKITFPLEYDNNKWYLYGKEIDEGTYGNKINDTKYIIIRKGEPTLGRDYFWSLSPNGQAKRVFSAYMIKDFKIEGNFCYYLEINLGLQGSQSIHKVDLDDPSERMSLGNPNYTYNEEMTLEIDHEKNILYQPNHANWSIHEDGIHIMGFDKRSIAEYYVVDLNLLENTYGYYILSKDSGDQSLLEQKNIKWNN